MLLFLLSRQELRELLAGLGYEVSEDQLKRTVEYYLARTSHGSTLSSVVSAWVLARYHPEEAWRFLQRALDSDVADVQGGTTAEGIHLGAMAGTVDIVLRCLTGMRARGRGAAVRPGVAAAGQAAALQHPLPGPPRRRRVRRGPPDGRARGRARRGRSPSWSAARAWSCSPGAGHEFALDAVVTGAGRCRPGGRAGCAGRRGGAVPGLRRHPRTDRRRPGTRHGHCPAWSTLLGSLANRFAAVALVSGRPAAYLAEHAAAPGVRYLGMYGLQEIRDGRVWVDPRLAAGRAAVVAARGGAAREAAPCARAARTWRTRTTRWPSTRGGSPTPTGGRGRSTGRPGRSPTGTGWRSCRASWCGSCGRRCPATRATRSGGSSPTRGPARWSSPETTWVTFAAFVAASRLARRPARGGAISRDAGTAARRG